MPASTSAFQGLTSYFLFLLFTATIGPLLFGYHLAELNAPTDIITCAKKSINSLAATDALPQCIPMSPTQLGLVSSSFTLGGLFGAIAAGPLSARSGGLKSMLYTAVVATVGPVFEALAPNIGTIVLGRLISGLAAGAAMVVTPIYISEIAPPGKKGFFGSFTQVMVNVGILSTQIQGMFLSKGQLWRIILAVAGAIAFVQALLLLLGGQESPKWMAENGKPSRAKRVLRKIRGDHADIDAEVASWGGEGERDLEDEEEALLANEDRDQGETSGEQQGADKPASRQSLNVLQALRDPTTTPAMVAVTAVMLAQQLCGINSIVMYGVSLLSDLLEANSALLNVAVSALNAIITMSAAPLVDKLGRKMCLLLSIAGMGTMSVMLGIGIMRHIPLVSATAVVLFVASFGLGLGPVPFILASELVDAPAVGAVQSWALSINWIATFIVAQFFPVLNEMLGKGQVYFIFAAMAVVFGGFVAFYVPETKGKANADEVWGRKKGSARED